MKKPDRSQELRNMMKITAAKQSISIKSSSSLISSGKDKVQLLKSLKEKEKQTNNNNNYNKQISNISSSYS